ncbi:Regulator of chromosome condensation (RCC1) family protein [Rhynchospora pubera]|uniref:Regulator of chromosome condensation (RCC1) family protein n=1 Tax=Rhynchospora pubera TaxID=906938 RepID=A0AAV8GJH2_9POAL|nr:Regulator of chromosome condensation (RCC1) family protein [Rhynchospora pubera]
MADLFNYGNSDRDIEQALIALKRGTQLIKCSRKGKPKLRSFRLSIEETTLIWISHKKQKSIKLSSVTKIIPGQRTAVFSRYPLPEKEYLSFSLVYRKKSDERTLDLICKDQAEVEIWFCGLQALIKSNSTQRRKARSDTSSEYTFSDDGGDSIRSNNRALSAVLDLPLAANKSWSPGSYVYLTSSKSDHAGHSPEHSNMLIRGSTSGSNVDGTGRLSVSSAPGSTNVAEDIESLGDVFVWGEVWNEGPQFQKADVLFPKQLETDVAIDVQQVAGGVGHAALVTRQGDVFTWGEEFSGRLGRGYELSVSRPKPVEVFSSCNMELVACGEFHTCAINVQGELFTWGDVVHKAGVLGHGSEVGHLLPKRVSGPLEGTRVICISCGSWHTALVTFNNKLFTFGEGAFGALGHNNHESISYPKEVKSWSGLEHFESKGLKGEVRGTSKVACGLWHTAAIVEVVKTKDKEQVQVSSQIIFTWGDGGKFRLGHGDREARLMPALVESLCSYNFHQIACGHNLTVALTTSGRVITMGDSAYGQLGTAKVNSESPNLVILADVEDIACGASHVVALTQRSELYTWGRGANGRLGHGDTEDRDKPTLVESLRDRHVKSISCGASFTACICIHKWVPTNDQSVCAGCRQTFGFARKRHTCYHCGLVHCHACSSRKALKAQLAPNPGKPHRVCDLCFAKLHANETNIMTAVASNRFVMTRRSTDQGRASRLLLQSPADPVRYSDTKPARNEGKLDSLSIIRASQVQSILPLPTSLSALHAALRPIVTSSALPTTGNGNSSNGGTVPGSPYSRKPSPPPSTPFITVSAHDNKQKKTIETLQNEVQQLQLENGELKRQKEVQQTLFKNAQRQAQKDAASKEAAKCNATLDLIGKFETQLKEIGDNVPPEVFETLTALRKLTHGQADQDQPRITADNTGNTYEAETSMQGTVRNSVDNIPFEEFEDRFEPGVYVTYARYQDGSTAFKRIRFNRKRFNNPQATVWWNENCNRVFQRYTTLSPNPDAVLALPPPTPPMP